MSTDLIRYDLLVQEALKSVVRRVLADVARDGLPGDHHFYVSFRTDHPGVRLSQSLRERYPQDMTIVLQHQFETLTISDTGFEVGLSFSGIAERLRVPYDSLTGFFDPSVQFGLKFETSESEQAADPAEEPVAPTPIPVRAVPAKGAAKPAKKAGERKSALREVSTESPSEPASGGGEVVSLDAFRKKS